MLKSLKEYLTMVLAAFKRFPLAIAFAIFTPVAYSYYFYNNDSTPTNIIQSIFSLWCVIYPVEAMLIALTTSLIQESRKNRSKLPQILSSVGWLIISIILVYLLKTPDYYNLSSIFKIILCIYVISFTLISSGILFIKGKNRLWNFQQKFLNSMINAETAMTILVILTYIIFDLTTSLPQDNKNLIYLNLALFYFFSVFPILCMAGIPRIDERLNEIPLQEEFAIAIESKYFNISVNLNKLFIFSLYTLYAVYVFDISVTALTEWDFDLTTILTHAVILSSIITMLILNFYPALISSKPSFEKKFVRVIPYTCIPIVVTMTAGIVERISEYGISENRLYFLGINLFLYILIAFQIIPKIISTKYIVIIFCTIFTVLTIGPINAKDVTRNIWLNNIKEALVSEGYTAHPLSEKAARDFFSNLWKKDEHKASIIASQVIILHSRPDKKLYQYFPEKSDLADIIKKYHVTKFSVHNNKIHTAPEKFSKFAYVYHSFKNEDLQSRNDTIFFDYPLKDIDSTSNKVYRFYIPHQKWMQKDVNFLEAEGAKIEIEYMGINQWENDKHEQVKALYIRGMLFME